MTDFIQGFCGGAIGVVVGIFIGWRLATTGIKQLVEKGAVILDEDKLKEECE